MTKAVATVSAKELTMVKKKTNAMVKAVEAVDVTKPADVKELGVNIKKMGKYVKGEQDKYIDPAKKIIENAKEQYGPYLTACKEAEMALKEKVTAHILAERKKEDDEKERLAKRVEKGTMKADTAVAKMENIKDTGKSLGGVTVRTIKKIRITDVSKIPREFLIPDEVKIRQALLGGADIPGAEVYDATSTSL